jgi:F-type H+-transporting ATPase subunit delta
MAKDIDIASLLASIAEGENPETLTRLVENLAKAYPEKASKVAKELRLKEDFKDSNVFITSARELSPNQKNKIEAKLAEKFGNLNFTYKVDPTLLGGIVIKKGELVINNSLSFRTKELVTKLKSANLTSEAK